MSKHLFRRSLGLMLSAMLAVSALPLSALAAEAENAESPFTELAADHVTLDNTEFEYTGSPILPNVTVRVGETLLTLDQDYQLEYTDNIEVGQASVTVIGIATSGYTGRVNVPFYISEKLPEYTLVDILPDHVTINGSEFAYTGQPIEPSVTVTIDDRTLTAGQDYAIEYVNNLVPGTGTVIVRGIATASETLGYGGEVRVNFTILPVEDDYPLVEITREHVTIDGMEFPCTGQAIEPKITVTVDGKVLTQGRDYHLKYEDNVQPGSAKAIVSGIATATEEGGYTGTVEVRFTILPVAEEDNPLVEIKADHVKLEGTEFVHTGSAIEPAVTVTIDGKVLTAGKDYSVKYADNTDVGTATVTVSGIATENSGYTGKVELTFTIQPRYAILEGDKAVWYQNSGKTLEFTINGEDSDFDYLTVDGKTVPSKYYTLKDGVFTLKNSFLSLLAVNPHNITFHYVDGEAGGTFKVAPEPDDSNPKTGDEFPLHGFSAVMFISLTGLIGAGYAYFKKLR